jgi:hypothetical protein
MPYTARPPWPLSGQWVEYRENAEMTKKMALEAPEMGLNLKQSQSPGILES